MYHFSWNVAMTGAEQDDLHYSSKIQQRNGLKAQQQSGIRNTIRLSLFSRTSPLAFLILILADVQNGVQTFICGISFIFKNELFHGQNSRNGEFGELEGFVLHNKVLYLK